MEWASTSARHQTSEELHFGLAEHTLAWIDDHTVLLQALEKSPQVGEGFLL